MNQKSLAYLLICTMTLSACATTAPQAATATAADQPPNPLKNWVMNQNRARRNAMIGALAGAVIGAATGGGDDMWKRAAAGALAGAAIGFAAGRRQDRLFAARDIAVQQASYDSSQGYVARLESVAFDPPETKPGKTTTLYVRYLVVGPDPGEAIKVRMFRGLKYGDDYIVGAGPNDFVVPRGGGIVEAKMTVTLPEKAPQGTYSVEALIEDPAGRFPQVSGTSFLSIIARGHTHAATAVASR
jgi:hypothetical protein